jgi:hypothetical protein
MATDYTVAIGERGVYLVDHEAERHGVTYYSCRKISQRQRRQLLAGDVEPETIAGRRVSLTIGNLLLAPECQLGIQSCREMGRDQFLQPLEDSQ